MQPFVLTTAEIPDYDIQLPGQEKVDEIGCYTFSVKPKKMVTGQALLRRPDLGGRPRPADREDLRQGRRRIEDGSSKNQASRSSRPTASRSTANTGSPPTPTPTIRCISRTAKMCRIRMTVKYQDYKKYEGRSTIKFGDVVDDGKPRRRPRKSSRRIMRVRAWPGTIVFWATDGH